MDGMVFVDQGGRCPDPGADSADPEKYKWKALLTVAMGNIMATMDMSITNIAFPTFTRIFHADITTVMWVTVAFILVNTSTMLVIGKISDTVGRKRIYTLGMAIFTMGLLACSLSRGIGQLVFFRILQATGAAMTISTSMAIVTEAFPPNEVGKGIGFLGMAVSVGFILGPIIGGFSLDWLGWRSIFYLRIPVGFLSFLMALFLLKPDRMKAGGLKLDLAGTLTSSAGICLFVFGVTQVRDHGLSSPRVHFLMGLGLVFIVLFLLVERQARNPVLDLTLFRNRIFSRAVWALFFTFVAAPAYLLLMPFYLIQGRGLVPSRAGMMMAVVSLTTMVVGPISGSLSDRFGPFRFSAAGASLILAAYGLLLFADVGTPLAALIPTLILLGMGIGSFQPANNSLIMGAAPRHRLGTASALTATQRQVGFSVGMAFTGTLFSARRSLYESFLLQGGASESSAAAQSIPPAFHDVLLFGIGLQVVVLVLCLVRRSGTGLPPGGRL
ncbi:MAG: DHA2 family efflux MFS transporter permease subunit [Deltaproteobacteria bacterium]|nr:DHA2 family efflux MFS transporter permease subunit [Deltaproteobacteria bacterium]